MASRLLLGALFVAALIFGLWHLTEQPGKEGGMVKVAERSDVATIVETDAEKAGNTLAEAADSAMETAGSAAQQAGEMASDAAEAVGSAAGDAMDAAGNAVAAVGESVEGMADSAGNALGEAAESAEETIETAMNTAGEAASSVGETVADAAEDVASFSERTAQAVMNAGSDEGSTDVLTEILGGMAYAQAREALIAGGWQPRTIPAEERANAQKESEAALLRVGFDELESCNDAERPLCRFEFVDGQDRIAAVLTAGAGENPQVIDAFLMKLER